MYTCHPQRVRRKKLFRQYLKDYDKAETEIYRWELRRQKKPLTLKQQIHLQRLKDRRKSVATRFWSDKFHKAGIFPIPTDCQETCPYYEECRRDMDYKCHQILFPEDKPDMPNTIKERKLWASLRKEYGLEEGKEMYFKMESQANAKYKHLFGGKTKAEQKRRQTAKER